MAKIIGKLFGYPIVIVGYSENAAKCEVKCEHVSQQAEDTKSPADALGNRCCQELERIAERWKR